jgi:small subunit ribosomal protein S9
VSDAEKPEQPADDGPVVEEPTPVDEPTAEEPAAEEPKAEEPAPAEEPAVEEPAPVEEPAAEEPAVEEPAPVEEPAAEEPAAEEPAPAAKEPVAEAEEIEEPAAPRVKPEIPGADLEPDIVPEGADALALGGSEDEYGEEIAASADGEEVVEEVQPIADAAIDLAKGARYTATGKRKTAVARVVLKPGTGEYTINGKSLDVFFPRLTLQRNIRQPLETVGYEARMDVVAKIHGGGVSAQAGALRHGIARALIDADPNLRGELKRRGFLTRDPRVKERKKAGLKKARKRPQFSKR